MRITDQDITRNVRQLRDEQNQQQNIRPWHRRRHFRVPAWLVAMPAAAIIGFILGLWTQSRMHTEEPLTALADTVYIKIKETQPQQDSTAKTVHVAVSPAKKNVVRTTSKNHRTQESTGRSVADDHIRYDLLVRN